MSFFFVSTCSTPILCSPDKLLSNLRLNFTLERVTEFWDLCLVRERVSSFKHFWMDWRWTACESLLWKVSAASIDCLLAALQNAEELRKFSFSAWLKDFFYCKDLFQLHSFADHWIDASARLLLQPLKLMFLSNTCRFLKYALFVPN